MQNLYFILVSSRSLRGFSLCWVCLVAYYKPLLRRAGRRWEMCTRTDNEGSQPIKIILIGSSARGWPHPYSTFNQILWFQGPKTTLPCTRQFIYTMYKHRELKIGYRMSYTKVLEKRWKKVKCQDPECKAPPLPTGGRFSAASESWFSTHASSNVVSAPDC